MDSPEKNTFYAVNKPELEIKHKQSIEKDPTPKNFEDILASLGGFGWFQALVIILYLTLETVTAFAIFIPIFAAQKPEPDSWSCDGNVISDSDVCRCNGTLKGSSQDSIISEWNLVCNEDWIPDFITSLQMLGLLFGSIFGSQIADWYGRKSGFLLSILLLALGSSVSATAPNVYIYAVSRLIAGAGIQCFINVTGAGVMEFMPPNYRSLANCIGPLGEGIMILSVMANYIRPWRTLYWATTIPYALIIVIYPFLPESPRWLLKQNKFEETQAVLNYVARCNRKPQVEMSVLKSIAEKENSKKMEEEQPGYLYFIKEKKLRTTSLFVMAIWFCWSLTYYGISFNVRNIGKSIYLCVFLTGVANALGQRFTLLTNDSLGRRMSLFSSMTFGALFTVVIAVCYFAMSEVSGDIVLIMNLLTIFGMSATRSTSKLLTGESFPTHLRAQSFGLSGMAITLGGILAPVMCKLGDHLKSAPFIILSIVSVSGAMVSFLIKETRGQNLDTRNSVKVKDIEGSPH